MSGTLVVRLKGMGDIVHLIPSLRLLRERFPGEPLGFLCQKPFGEVIPEELKIDLWQLSNHASFSEMLALIGRVRKKRYSRLLDFFCNPRTALISLLSGIPQRAGFDYRIRRWAYHQTFNPADYNLHLTELFGAFLSHFGLGGTLPPPNLTVVPALRDTMQKFLTENHASLPLLGVNPHATYPSKAWPMKHFADFINLWFEKTGKPALVFQGPGEERATQTLLAGVPSGAAFTHPPLRIPELLALLSRVSLFLTGDTGPMNLAWALNVPTIALFGPTTRKAVAPRGPHHLVLHHPDLSCLQCHKEVCEDGRCMTEMKPDWVFQKVRAFYDKLFPIPA